MVVEVLVDGPAPLIQAICREIDLTPTLDHLLAWDEGQCKLSPGTRIGALIINALMNRRPLFRLEEFYRDMDTAKLFGPGIQPDDLNDDALARALDKLAAAGPQRVYTAVALRVVCREQVALDTIHADTTSVAVQGAYDTEDDELPVLNLTYGYSKDHRPDLKQFLYGLGVTRDSIPVIGEVRDGNTSDQQWNRALIAKLRERLGQAGPPPVYVADSSLVSGPNLAILAREQLPFISRLPGTYGLEAALKARAWAEDNWQEVGPLSPRKGAATYKLQAFTAELEGRQYRFIVVHSSKLDGRKTRSIERRLAKREAQLEQACHHLARRQFACAPDAEEAWRNFLAQHQDPCFHLEAAVIPVKRRRQRPRPGRPPQGYVPAYETVYQLQPQLSRNEAAIETKQAQASCFVLITSLLAAEAWPARKVLQEYKHQTVVEQHFAFIKDPKIVGPIYLKKPERVQALAYVFLLALLVYSVIQRRVRQALAQEGEPPLVLAGKITSSRPTGRRILELFAKITIVKLPDGQRIFPRNVALPEHAFRLLRLDPKIYLRPPLPP